MSNRHCLLNAARFEVYKLYKFQIKTEPIPNLFPTYFQPIPSLFQAKDDKRLTLAIQTKEREALKVNTEHWKTKHPGSFAVFSSKHQKLVASKSLILKDPMGKKELSIGWTIAAIAPPLKSSEWTQKQL